MDPQSLSFTPQSEIWRLSNTMRSFQEVQQDHADRLVRLERRQEDDARIKSVWGPVSPFPGAMSTTPATPQHGPVNQPSSLDFTNFDDDQSNSMVRSLHLDADDEPRRFGVGSRANSVRFDASAKPGQWAHASRSSVDLLNRASSGFGGFGGHPLFERTISHKSDGRHSSAGQSAVSGRANSLMLDSTNALTSSSSLEAPGLTPGLFILGSVPSIIRCWLDTNFKHESLLYAAVCTGSYKSYLDSRLVDSLNLSGEIRQDISGDRRVRVSLYLPEAVQQAISSRSNSPAPQLPSLTIDFTVMDRGQDQATSKAIQIIVGSDILRAHNADILFSSNTLTIYDDDRNKLSVPFVRPENDEVFKMLITSATPPPSKFRPNLLLDTKAEQTLLANGVNLQHGSEEAAEAPDLVTSISMDQEQLFSPDDEQSYQTQSITPETTGNGSIAGQKHDRKPSPPAVSSSKVETKEASEESPLITASSRTSSSPAIWSNWRRDGTASNTNDWANSSRNASGNYQRTNRDQGIKVLKPIRQVSRNPSTTPLSASPTVTGQSRFFDDGKRRSGPSSTVDLGDIQQQQQQPGRRSTSRESTRLAVRDNPVASAVAGAAAPVGSKLRSANPVGGASAFGWLNSGGPQK